MYVKIIKSIPIKKWHLVEINGIYKAWKTKHGYIIESDLGKAVFVKEEEIEICKGEIMPFMLSDMAKCIKYLERMRHKITLGHYNERIVRGTKITCDTPIEHYFINEFPFYSCLCYVFRKFKVKGKAPKEVHVCYCPLKPYEHPEWPIHKTNYMGVEGEEIDTARRACNMFIGNKTGKTHLRSPTKMLERIEALPVSVIMKHLKKIKIPLSVRKHLCSLWFHHIQHRVEEWEQQNKRKFL